MLSADDGPCLQKNTVKHLLCKPSRVCVLPRWMIGGDQNRKWSSVKHSLKSVNNSVAEGWGSALKNALQFNQSDVG